MVGLKAATYVKISLKIVNPRDIAGNAKKKKKKKKKEVEEAGPLSKCWTPQI